MQYKVHQSIASEYVNLVVYTYISRHNTGPYVLQAEAGARDMRNNQPSRNIASAHQQRNSTPRHDTRPICNHKHAPTINSQRFPSYFSLHYIALSCLRQRVLKWSQAALLFIPKLEAKLNLIIFLWLPWAYLNFAFRISCMNIWTLWVYPYSKNISNHNSHIIYCFKKSWSLKI